MKHKHTLTVMVALFFFLIGNYNAISQNATSSSASKSQDQSSKRKCATMEHLAWMKQQDPSLEAKMIAEEKKFNDYITDHQQELQNNKATYTLPTVVHVVYNGTTGYVTPTQVAEQIAQTNSDWAGTNGRSMEAFASSLRADAGITLCLATIDPSGNPTTGIDYKTTTKTSFSTNDGVKSTTTGGANCWDYTKYLNIWVCNLPGYCGYAQFPTSGINSTYGVVIHYEYFGLTGAVAPYDLGGTVSHEFGHCFNLYHIWGDESACTGTDYCADVPNQADATYGNHSGVLTDACSTTSPGIMYVNFMDYSDDADYANMTPNQVSRMQSAVSTYLLTVANNAATACAAAAPPVADFSANTTSSCSGTIQFTDASTNTPTSWAWTFGDGGNSTLQNPSHTYIASGTYTVSLTATNADGSDTETKTNYITISLPTPPTTTGDTICSGQTATISASGSGTLNWYDAASGGTLINTGTTYTTPALTSTTTYYVESSVASASQYVGSTQSSSNGSQYTGATVHYLKFDALSALKIVSVEVNAGAAGNRTISLLNSSGATITSSTINIPAGVSRITLNFDVPVGSNYRLAGPASPNLWRNTSGGAYPYSITNLVSIDSCSASGYETSYYYFFYNWEVQSAPCTSSRTPVTVVVAGAPSVTITVSPNDTICSGTSTTFTATPVNGGTAPTYQWKKNGSNISGATNSTYTTTALANGDIITCVMTPNSVCSSTPVTSNSITITISAPVTASVSIAADPSETICAGTSVTFTASPTNGGSTPTYQWQQNGSNISGATNSTYTSTAFANGDDISCVMTSSLTSCVLGSPATSNIITMSLPTTPTTTNDTICGSGTANLSASGSGTLDWYDAASGGNLVNTGTTYTTPTISTTTTYYVESTSTTYGTSQYVPCPAIASATSSTTNRYHIFTVSVPVKLVSVVVKTTTAGNRTIEFRNSSGAVLLDTTLNIPSGTDTIYLNWDMPVGTNYQLGLSSTSTVALFRNSSGTSYPYQIAGVVSITGNSSSASYGFFYSWEVQPLTTCSSSRAPVTAVVTPGPAASVSISANPSGAICTGTSVTFTATATNGGTLPAYQWQLNGSPISGATNSTYTSSALSNGNVITCIMTSNLACVTSSPATSNSVTMSVNAGGPASVTISQSPIGSICAGTSVTFTAAPTNGGTPTYQWQLNGSNISGATNSTYTSTTLANNNVITCIMTSSLSCATGSPATSNSITMTVYPSVPVTISITANPSGSICTGTSVTFTAAVTNGGTTPTYQWKKNSTNITGATTTTYTSSTLANNDVITCTVSSSVTCASPVPATSNSITMSVSSAQPASVSIAANPGSTVCIGTSVTFSATPTNGGSPTYQWQLNGSNISGATNSTYTSSTLADADVITCIMTSSLSCATGSPATSNVITMVINSPSLASVSISANPSGAICAGTNVTFTATPTNGGTSPTYQWQLNSSNISGATNSIYSSSTLADADVITCIMTSNDGCVTGSPATSNSVTITISASVAASVSIAASPSATVCSGDQVTLTATAVNGGSSPSYQWQLNGNNVGPNSSVVSTSALSNGDVITCIMTSSLSCATGSPATSNTITMSVTTSVVLDVAITANPSGAICTGTNVTFTAVSQNPTSSPTYQWQVNGANVGTNSTTYSSSSIANGDIVTCILSSTSNCVSNNPVTSNPVVMSVSTSLPVSITISPTSSLTVCAGEPVSFMAFPTNGGTSPTYQWQVNSSNVGTNSSTLTYSSFNDGDVVTCIMTSSLSCATGNPATSNSQTVSIYPAPATPVLTQSGDTLYSNSPSGNQWYFSNILGSFAISGATGSSYIPLATGNYYVIVTDANGCVSDTSNIISVVVGINEIESAIIELYPNPSTGTFDINYHGLNDNAEIKLVNSIGQILLSKEIRNNTITSINASFLSSGMYFLQLTTDEETHLFKVLITK